MRSHSTGFSDKFFGGLDVKVLRIGGNLSPKVLIIKAEARLSWQYHNRRAEIWQHTDKGHPSNKEDFIRPQEDIRKRKKYEKKKRNNCIRVF